MRSGSISNEYFDKCLLASDRQLPRTVAEGLVELRQDDAQSIGGLELGGLPLATTVSQITRRPTLFVRKQAKNYGTYRLAEGGEVEGVRLALIADIVTSGGPHIESCTELRAHGADIRAVLCVIDREADGAENLRAHGLQRRALFTMTQPREAAGARAG